MEIEIKKSLKLIDYSSAIKFLEKRAIEVIKEKKPELLWILEHKTVYTAGTSANEKDLKDVPKKVKEDIKLTVVSNVDEVIKIALTKELKPVEWVEVEAITEPGKDQKTPASRH